MNILEPCCYTKQFNRFLAEEKMDTIPVYHSGDIFSSHIIERVQMLAHGGSTLWVVLQRVTSYTMMYIRKAAKRMYYDKASKSRKPMFASINILVSEMSEGLKRIALQEGQTLTIAVMPELGLNLIGSTYDWDESGDERDNFGVFSALLVTGAILQVKKSGLHLLEIHRGSQQRDMIIPFVRSRMKISKVYSSNP